MRIKHYLYVPFTGLGLYQGFRGERWLRNRIKVFKQFVIPSLLNQTSKNFILWISFRYEEKDNAQVRELQRYMETIKEFQTVFTFSGCCFWDDKYPDAIANERLITAVHGAMGELMNYGHECDYVLMTIQPSDDTYHKGMVEEVQKIFREQEDIQAVAYQKGYIMDYTDRRLAEWNPKTNPPFFTIKFPHPIFIDPYQHVKYTGPYKSHEYVGDALKLFPIYERGFTVGVHGENISTIFNHPFAGSQFIGDVRELILNKFGLDKVPPLKLNIGWRKKLMTKLPHGWRRKIRYWFGERFFNK